MAPSKLYVILPVLNKSVITNSRPPWVLSGDLVLRAIDDRERRLLIEDASIVFPSEEISGEIFILALDNIVSRFTVRDSADHRRKVIEENVRLDALALQTVFNFLAVEETMMIPYGIVLEGDTKPKLLYTLDFEQDFYPSKLKNYTIITNVTGLEVQQLIEKVRNIIRADKSLQITLRRFCSAFMKSNMEDRLIDLTIALESLIVSSTEISFKFSFYLSLLISRDKIARNDIYKKLKGLYSARSSIVHGIVDNRAKQEIDNAKNNWEALVSYAKQCILYRIEFVDKNPGGNSVERWMEHLLSLGFGESPIE